MNRDEVLQKMEPLMNIQVREVEHNPRTRVVVTPDMVTFRPGGGARTLEMTKEGVQSLANFAGLPWNIAAKLRPNTFSDVSSQLLEHKRRYSLLVKDGAVTKVIPRGEYRTINPERALRSIEAGVPGIDYHRVMMPDATTVALEVVGEKREPVHRGDLIRAGASITFSPIGAVLPTIQSYVLRLTCTNGAKHNTVLREFQYTGGDSGGNGGGDIWNWFRRSSRDAYNALDSIVQRYRQMMNEQITPEDRAMMLEALLRDAKIGGEAANAVRAMAIENPPQNTYEMHNLITYATSHLLDRPEQIARAQLTAATYSSEDTHARVCPVCHSRRN